MRDIDTLVIHCSATPDGETLFRGGRTPVEIIDGWHRERGFRRGKLASARSNPTLGHIGYHYVIYRNGAIATGRGEDEVGAHARGYNDSSLALCLIGTDRYTLAQWRSLKAWVEAQTQPQGRMAARYPHARVVGHRDLPGVAKACPGFDVATWRRGDMAPLVGHLFVVAP